MILARTTKIVTLIIFLSLMISGGAQANAPSDPFPLYEEIAPNVAFWTKIYSQYSTSHGVVHDSIDLSIIYEVIDLKPYDAPGARKVNRKRIKRAKEKYRRTLMRLANNPSATDAESQRVAGLFESYQASPQKAYRRAASRIRCQIGQKDRFRAGLIRSGAYIDQIRIIFRSHGLPEDLVYLPHVESSFNPKAYSKFGAAGIWQFTRSTGKRFMKVGYVLDERRDPLRASQAAAQLLKENQARLNDWPLAITAYNHGAAGMARAQKKHGTYPAIFQSYRGRTFKFASRNFYPEFLAARQVASNYQEFFGDLILDRPKPSRQVTLEGFAAFDALSRHFEIDPRTLKKMNPALRQPVFSGQKHLPKGYTLRLPQYHKDAGSATLAHIPDSLYHQKQRPSHFYTVQRGDTAGKIARMHGVRLNDLILANNLNRRATIYRHQTLRIPQKGERVPRIKQTPVEPTTTIAMAKTERSLEEKDTPQTKATLAPVQYPNPVLASVIPLPTKHTPAVPENVKAWPEAASTPNVEVVTADVGFNRLSEHNGRPVGTIEVEVEETLGHYAEWAKVRTQQIRWLNGLQFGRLLHLHQKVKIPLHRTSAQAFEEARYEFHKRLQEDFFAVYRIGELHAYHVQQGDSYWTLCREKFGVPMWLLKHCNPEVNFAELRLRQKLIIPTIEKASPDDAGFTDDESAAATETIQTAEEVSLKKVSAHVFP